MENKTNPAKSVDTAKQAMSDPALNKKSVQKELGKQKSKLNELIASADDDVNSEQLAQMSLESNSEPVTENVFVESAVQADTTAQEPSITSSAGLMSTTSLTPLAALAIVGAGAGGGGGAGSNAQPKPEPESKIPTTLTLKLKNDSGKYDTDNITNQSKVNVIGLETGAAWEYKIDDGPWTSGIQDSFELQSGAHTYQVRQTLNGVTSKISDGKRIELDTTPPVAATFNAIATDNIVNESEANSGVVISGTKEVGASVVLTLSGKTLGISNSDAPIWSMSLTKADVEAIGQGYHALLATQTDAAGNVTTSERNIEIDTIRPNDAVITPAVDTGENTTDGITSNKTIDIKTDDDATWMYQVGDQIDESKWIVGTGNSFELQQGEHKYHVKQTDSAGNESITSVKLNLDADKPQFTDPQTIQTTAQEGDRFLIYSANVTDETEIRYSLEGDDAFAFDVDPVTGKVFIKNQDYEKPEDKDKNNNYEVTLKATDLAGNFSTMNLKITVVDKGEAGDLVIDLGEGRGQLINGMQVEGKWYYMWDQNKSGRITMNDFDVGGQYDDRVSMDYLAETLMGLKPDGNKFKGVDITESSRMFNVDGIKLLLPLSGSAMPSSWSSIMDTESKKGTGWSRNTAGWNTDPNSNVTYDDLLAIWDAHNGTSENKNISMNTTNIDQSDPLHQWVQGYWWSGDTFNNTHHGYASYLGQVGFDKNENNNFAVFQVL